MSHYLSSVNQEASDAIRPAVDLSTIPGVGASVRFHAPLGFGRDGRTVFPALVQNRRDDGTLDLTVFYDAGDQIDELRVPEHSDTEQTRCWAHPEGMIERPIERRLEEPGGLRGLIASLDEAVFGDYERPPIALVDILQAFETKIRDMRSELTAAGIKAPTKKK